MLVFVGNIATLTEASASVQMSTRNFQKSMLGTGFSKKYMKTGIKHRDRLSQTYSNIKIHHARNLFSHSFHHSEAKKGQREREENRLFVSRV